MNMKSIRKGARHEAAARKAGIEGLPLFEGGDGFASKCLALVQEDLAVLSEAVERAVGKIDAMTGRETLDRATEDRLWDIRHDLLAAQPYARAFGNKNPTK